MAIQLLNRGQDELQLIYVDPRSGRSRTVMTETDAHWINLTNDLTFLSGDRFLWTSERSGFRHQVDELLVAVEPVEPEDLPITVRQLCEDTPLLVVVEIESPPTATTRSAATSTG